MSELTGDEIKMMIQRRINTEDQVSQESREVKTI